MKRDMDLIRKLLLALENDQPLGLTGYDQKNLTYHKVLLVESGLADGMFKEVGVEEYVVHISRLSWTGHEFLDAARDDKGWRQVSQIVGKTVGTVSLSLLQALLNQWAAKELGLP